MKRIALKNVLNMRDLGGFCTCYNRETKYNMMIRSNVIQKLDNTEVNYFIKRNIKTIIDLREDGEIEVKRNYFSTDKRFKCYVISLRGRNIPKLEKEIATNYISIIDDKESIYKVFKIILESKSGVIFNCNSGKDRTGMIAMLLLLLCGVDKSDIVADYSLSYIYLKEEIDKFHEDNPKMPKYVGGSKSKYIEETLDIFYKKYHNIENYMQYIGFNSEEILNLREKLLCNEKIF